MATTETPQGPTSPYASRPVTKAPAWHGLVTFDIWFNNLSSGLFLAAALAELTSPTDFTRVASVAYAVAMAFLLVDLALLVMDLGDPLRFHHMLRVVKLSSPMSLGTWSLTTFSLPVTAVVLVDWFAPEGDVTWWLHRVAVVAGILPALAVAVYKGVLFSTSSQPGWKDARWLGGYLTNSAVTMGCAELLALALLTGPASAVVRLVIALQVLLVLNAVTLGLLARESRAALSQSQTPAQLTRLRVVVPGLSVVLPFALLLVPGATFQLLAVACVLAGALLVRHEIIRLPHRRGPAEH